jgi:diguanylate cyclase (GGDEF)-like protein/PAS domain S-box-containing protein
MAAKKAAPLSESALDHLLVEGVSDYAIFVVAPGGTIVRWNLGAQTLFGYTGAEVIGRHFRMLFTPEDDAAAAPENELMDALSGPATGHDRWHVRKDGSLFWGMNTAQPLYGKDGTLLGFTKIVRDLTERYLASEALRDSAEQLRALAEETQHAAVHDDLTGLANKALFREYLGRAIARSERRPSRTFAVIFLDLDGFKATNDRFGHAMADRLLVEVTRRLQRAVRAEDIVARLGGDEFAMLIEDIEGAADALTIAEHILTCFRVPFALGEAGVSASASLGIAVASDYESRAPSADQLLADADLAMYEAKSLGRARSVLFRGSMRTRAAAALALDNDLHGAVERDEMRAFYEPIVDLRTREIRGFEALARWNHPQLGLLQRSAYRVRAEETGVIVGIDRWLFSSAAHQLDAWQKRPHRLGRLTMSIELSGKDFERPELAADLRAILADTALPHHSMAVEVDETLSIENEGRVAAILSELKTIGIDLHLSDFGRSSLDYVNCLPVAALKIGASFVRVLESDPKAAAIVAALLAFARSLGLKCIAEGVETEGQRTLLLEFGCEEAQGPLFSAPVTAHEATGLLAAAATTDPQSFP